MAAIDDVFNALFFGAGAWLGWFLFVILIVGLVMKWKEMIVLALPATIILGYTYIYEWNLGWQGILMILLGIFLLFRYVANVKGGE